MTNGGQNAYDLIGYTFGFLTVVRLVEVRNGHRYFYCTCGCGGSKIIAGHNLRSGHVKSCGCYRKHFRVSELISLQEAIRQGKPHYYTGKPCKNGHVTARDVKSRSCLECQTIRINRYRASLK